MITYFTVKTIKTVAEGIGGMNKGPNEPNTVDLGLLPNECIILHEISVNHSEAKFKYKEELYLTNINLICVNRENNKKYCIYKYPLEQIIQTNGQYHVYIGNFKGKTCLNIDIFNKTQSFVFKSQNINIINTWINRIMFAINTIIANKQQNNDMKDLINALNQNINNANAEKMHNTNNADIDELKEAISNLNEKIDNKTNEVPVQDNINRRQEYAGTVLKCPNCGNLLNDIDLFCTNCGYQKVSNSTNSGVKELQQQLMMIENSRRNNGDDNLIFNKKITLIESFPIPNTYDDIMEMAFMAYSNINVYLSKNSIIMQEPSNEKRLSDAWVLKLKQAYQKARFTFTPEMFKKIDALYCEKMVELNFIRLKK